MIFQDNNLFGHLTVQQNVALGIRPNLRLNQSEWDKVERVLDRVGLSGRGPALPAKLSGGQVARVAIARVLVQKRPLLLLDEPFAALGPGLKAEMLDLVAEVADDTEATVILVSHDPQDAKRFADQTVLVAEGKALEPVDTNTLFASPPPALKAYLGASSGSE